MDATHAKPVSLPPRVIRSESTHLTAAELKMLLNNLEESVDYSIDDLAVLHILAKKINAALEPFNERFKAILEAGAASADLLRLDSELITTPAGEVIISAGEYIWLHDKLKAKNNLVGESTLRERWVHIRDAVFNALEYKA